MRFLANFTEDRRLLNIGGISGSGSSYVTPAVSSGYSAAVADLPASQTQPKPVDPFFSSAGTVNGTSHASGRVLQENHDKVWQTYTNASEAPPQPGNIAAEQDSTGACVQAGGSVIAALVPLIASLC